MVPATHCTLSSAKTGHGDLQVVAQQAKVYGEALARETASGAAQSHLQSSGGMVHRMAAIGLDLTVPSSTSPPLSPLQMPALSPIAGLLARRTPPAKSNFDSHRDSPGMPHRICTM